MKEIQGLEYITQKAIGHEVDIDVMYSLCQETSGALINLEREQNRPK